MKRTILAITGTLLLTLVLILFCAGAQASDAPAVLTHVSLSDFDGMWEAVHMEIDGAQTPFDEAGVEMQLTISNGVLYLSSDDAYDIPCRLDGHELVVLTDEADFDMILSLHEARMLSWPIGETRIWFAPAQGDTGALNPAPVPTPEETVGVYTDSANRYHFIIPMGWTAIDEARAGELLDAGPGAAGVSSDVLEMAGEIKDNRIIMLFEADKLGAAVPYRNSVNIGVEDMRQAFSQTYMLSLGDALTEMLQGIYPGYVATVPPTAASYGQWEVVMMGGEFVADGQRIALRQAIFSAGNLLVTATLTAGTDEITDDEFLLAELVTSFVLAEGQAAVSEPQLVAPVVEAPASPVSEESFPYEYDIFLSLCEEYDIALDAGARQSFVNQLDTGYMAEYVPMDGAIFSYSYDSEGTVVAISLRINTGVPAANQVAPGLLILFAVASDADIEDPAEMIGEMIDNAEDYIQEGYTILGGLRTATADPGGRYSYELILVSAMNEIWMYAYPKH